MVREYKGSHSGEHGDGLVRSEFHEAMFGGRLVRAFEEVKDGSDPGVMCPSYRATGDENIDLADLADAQGRPRFMVCSGS